MAAERVIAGLSCGDVLARLGYYLDGELSPDALAAVQAHVAGCSECERFGGAYAKVVQALRATHHTHQDAAIEEGAIESLVRRAQG
jgi:anti-sigma factor RsiW